VSDFIVINYEVNDNSNKNNNEDVNASSVTVIKKKEMTIKTLRKTKASVTPLKLIIKITLLNSLMISSSQLLIKASQQSLTLNVHIKTSQLHQLSKIHLMHVKELIHIFKFLKSFLFIIIFHDDEALFSISKNFHHYII